MRVSRLLSFQLMKEVLQYAALSFLALTMVLLTQNGLRQLDELVTVGATLDDCVDIIACLLPLLSAYTLPIAFLFGVIIAVSRMSAEGEILALSASGLGLASLLVPALTLAALISAASAHVMINVEHRAHRELRALVETLAARGGMLEPGKFRSLVGRTLLVNERDRENNLRGVMISDRTDSENAFTIFAERGRFSYDEAKQTFTLGLRDGALHLDPDPKHPARVRTIAFESLDYSFDVTQLISTLTSAVRPRQMTSTELRDVVRRAREGSDLGELHQRNPIEYELEIHRRYALPAAPLAFALIAVPLGLGRATRTRSRGALISLALAFAYYGVFSQARFLALDGWVDARYALWIPNVVFCAIAVLLAVRVRHVIED